MGFLNKLLNKSNSEQNQSENLDIPPPPEYNNYDLPNLAPEQQGSQQPPIPEVPPPPSYAVPPPVNQMPPPPSFEMPEQSLIPPIPETQDTFQQQMQDGTTFEPQPMEEIIPKNEPVSAPIVEEKDPFDITKTKAEPASSFGESLEEETSEDIINDKRKELIESGDPIFAKVEDYKRIIDASNHMKDSVKECESVLKRLNELKLESDREYQRWKDELLDMHKKFSYIDKVIFD
jgi:hypothetical protein